MSYPSPTPYLDAFGSVADELLGFMLGDHLGSGEYRVVYTMPSDPANWVYKIERPHAERLFCNVTEWNLWDQLQDTPAGQWLAPCRAISRSGSILVMARTKPLVRQPKELPNFLCDTHRGNLGLYKGRVVCHDYGFLWPITRRLANARRVRMKPNSRRNS